MKYEITKGSEKDFDGAPEWATLLLKGRFAAKAWASSYSNGAKALTPGTTDKYIIDAIEDCTIIAERRPITEPVWDGEGLPPVGVECEFDWSGEGFNVGTVRYISKQTVIIECAQVENSYGIEDLTFRPIRSPDEVARDEAIKAMREALGHAAGLIEVSNIYRAIAAGKIPGVLLESKAADLKINITTDEMWREFEKKSDMEDVYKLFRERESRRGSF